MKLKPTEIIGAVFSGIACMASIITCVDEVKNGNKRAAIAGDAAGRAAVDESEKRYKKTLFGEVEISKTN